MILSNKAQCKKCGDIIESKHVHDFVSCDCGEISVDGGHDYLKRSAYDFDNVIELSEVTEDEIDKNLKEFEDDKSKKLIEKIIIADDFGKLLESVSKLVEAYEKKYDVIVGAYLNYGNPNEDEVMKEVIWQWDGSGFTTDQKLEIKVVKNNEKSG
jgi:hypothetical protein